MIDHEVAYERNLTGSYMKIAATGNAKFDERMMLKRKLKGLLAVEQYFYNGRPWYWYNISGKQSLDTYCKITSVGMNFIEKMIMSICDEIEILEWNLLDQRCLILDPEYIFINNMNDEIIFTIYPGNREEVSKQFQQLMEFLLTKLDHSDVEAVRTAYTIYEKSLNEAYMLTDLRDSIIKVKNDKLNKEPEIDHMQRSSEEKPITEKNKTTIEINEDTKEKRLYDNMLEGLVVWKNSLLNCIHSKLKSVAIVQKLGKTVRKEEEAVLFRDNVQRKTQVDQKEKGKSVQVVYPDETVPEEFKPQIHPTICINSMQSNPMGILQYEGADNMENITIEQNVRIGKSSQADVQIPRETISQFHAKVEFEDGAYYLEDLNSTNGTYVNEEALVYKERRKLNTNDIVRFADLRYRFL